MMMNNTAIMILAAGAASRIGSPKQLLNYQGKTLLRRIVDVALESFKSQQIMVVLGASHEAVLQTIKETDVLHCLNKDWERGMASSIRSGLTNLLNTNPDLAQCFIALCDQPHVHNHLFQEMKALSDSSSKGIVASEYAKTLGVPALFSNNYFNHLLALTGEQGAKKIILQNLNDVATIKFEQGAVDIDTKSDYTKLTKH